MTDLVAAVTDWLNTQSGYALEMVVAKGLQDAEFSVVQSEYLLDVETQKWREVDVVAYAEESGKTARCVFAFVVECKTGKRAKGSKGNPWILFTTTGGTYPTYLSINRRATTTAGQSILSALGLNPKIVNAALFEMPARPGYGLTMAFRDSDRPDVTYDALNSVCKAAVGMVQRLSTVKAGGIISFVWPAIVIDAPLLETYLEQDGGALQVSDESTPRYQSRRRRRLCLSQPHVGRKLWREQAWALKHRPAEIGQNRQTLRRHLDKD